MLAGRAEKGLHTVNDLTDRDGGRLSWQLKDLDFNAKQDALGSFRQVSRFVLNVKDFIDLSSRAGDPDFTLIPLTRPQGDRNFFFNLNFDLIEDREVEDFLIHPHAEVIEVKFP